MDIIGGDEPDGKPFQTPRKPGEFMRNFRRDLHADKDARLPGAALARRRGGPFVWWRVYYWHCKNFPATDFAAGRQAMMTWRKAATFASV
jgi:hypothetical protein